MPSPRTVAEDVVAALTWNARVAIVRRVPEVFGLAQQAAVYAEIAKLAYVPTLQSNSAYVHRRPEYELGPLSAAYQHAVEGTSGFTRVTTNDLATVLVAHPETLRVFRLLLGFTAPEFSETCRLVAARYNTAAVGETLVDALGPVIRDTGGRTFTLATLAEMIGTEPFPDLRGLTAPTS